MHDARALSSQFFSVLGSQFSIISPSQVSCQCHMLRATRTRRYQVTCTQRVPVPITTRTRLGLYAGGGSGQQPTVSDQPGSTGLVPGTYFVI